jgi:hypothetical protein
LTKNFFTANKKSPKEDSEIKAESFNIINLSKINQVKLIAMPKMREASQRDIRRLPK